ncbi:sigma-Y antisigma factor component [Peribacillus saganii]|uniref:Sigma-Y antisigma factor component n=1 Tax=Peribacillus saganii TaxID=2303992 RepID=A0A372LR33_9BACI|nr:sigma-Y antisigma factor component [Peribacillus saganii]RFU70655.1 sigma-Y antisigma factor component [Peribacillus saganii]
MTENELMILPLVALILLAQSVFLFTNAKKHGHNYWLWGILGLVQAPVPTIIYLLFVRKARKDN